jgi:hypothetical protein
MWESRVRSSHNYMRVLEIYLERRRIPTTAWNQLRRAGGGKNRALSPGGWQEYLENIADIMVNHQVGEVIKLRRFTVDDDQLGAVSVGH